VWSQSTLTRPTVGLQMTACVYGVQLALFYIIISLMVIISRMVIISLMASIKKKRRFCLPKNVPVEKF